jgi:hypothetical protein
VQKEYYFREGGKAMAKLMGIVFLVLAVSTLTWAQDVGSPNQIAAKKFYDDTRLVTALFAKSDVAAAKNLAKNLLDDAEGFAHDCNYGNAVHAANIVLGRIAIKEEDLEAAGEYLIAAGNSPGSPQLDTFGPDMNLARELLAVGEKKVVLTYFELCAKFWKMNDGKLKEWTTLVEDGKTPEFGANLRYFAPPTVD